MRDAIDWTKQNKMNKNLQYFFCSLRLQFQHQQQQHACCAKSTLSDQLFHGCSSSPRLMVLDGRRRVHDAWVRQRCISGSVSRRPASSSAPVHRYNSAASRVWGRREETKHSHRQVVFVHVWLMSARTLCSCVHAVLRGSSLLLLLLFCRCHDANHSGLCGDGWCIAAVLPLVCK